MASTPPGPSERCPPESADHRCSRVRRGLKGGTRRVAGGARARTDQTEFRNRPAELHSRSASGGFGQWAPVEGRWGRLPPGHSLSVSAARRLSGSCWRFERARPSWGGPVGRSSPWSTWVAARYTQHVGDQFGRQSTVRLGAQTGVSAAASRLRCLLVADCPSSRSMCGRPPKSPLNRQRVAP
jgi:hypothetical protein